MELLELRKNELLETCNCFETLGMRDSKCYSNVIAQYGVLSSVIYDIKCAELRESMYKGMCREECIVLCEYELTLGFPDNMNEVNFRRSSARQTVRRNRRMTVKKAIDLNYDVDGDYIISNGVLMRNIF